MLEAIARPPSDMPMTQLPWFPIVMLHRVVETTPRPNPYNLCISQRDLARLISHLRGAGFLMTTIEDAYAAWERGEPVDKLACLTFDDGYADFYTHAMPVLDALLCPASVAIVTSRLGGTNAWDSEELPEAPLLSADQVKELAVQGVRFGVHSATHPRLPSLTSAQRIAEIAGARSDLEALIDQPAEVFVYPHWEQDDAIQHEVFEAGFKAACGGEQSDHTPFNLHRVDLARMDELSMAFRLRGWRHRLHRSPAGKAARVVARSIKHRGN